MWMPPLKAGPVNKSRRTSLSKNLSTISGSKWAPAWATPIGSDSGVTRREGLRDTLSPSTARCALGHLGNCSDLKPASDDEEYDA